MLGDGAGAVGGGLPPPMRSGAFLWAFGPRIRPLASSVGEAAGLYDQSCECPVRKAADERPLAGVLLGVAQPGSKKRSFRPLWRWKKALFC